MDIKMKEEYRQVLDKEKRYSGDKKAKFLQSIADDANGNHDGCHGAWRTSLEHAKLAGDAIRTAQRILGYRLKWSRWRQKNFKASVQTARVYAPISRHWDDPSITAARNDGMQVDSIQGFLDVPRGRHKQKDKSNQSKDSKALRKALADLFRIYLYELDDCELSVLHENRNRYRFKAYLWLREEVCKSF